MPKRPFPFIKPAKDLKDSLRFTHLDIENPGFVSGSVQGFGFLNKDLKTQYPSTSTGKPTPTQYPNGPAKRFITNFGPRNVYLNQVKIKQENSPLEQSLESSKLDDIDNPINLGIGDPTVYPSNITGKPSPTQYPSGAPEKFKQVNNNQNIYLDQVKIKQENSPLEQSLESSKLDDSINPNPDPTIYPLTSKGISSTGGFFPIKGVSSKKFEQRYNSNSTYLNYIFPFTSPAPIFTTSTGRKNSNTSAEEEFGPDQIKRDKEKV